MKNLIKNVLGNSTLIVTLLAASSIFVVIAYNGSQMPSDDKPTEVVQIKEDSADEVAVVLSKVSVQQVKIGRYQAQVIGFGEAASRFELNYTSEVSGRVDWVADNFEVGTQVAKGDLLATLDDRTYQQLVSQAKSDLATAELELLEEQREGEQARSEWARSGLKGEPDSALVFRKPQLTSAKASVENAKKSFISAQKDLTYTQIRAPFDGVITTRDIQLGAYITVGGAIATLYSADRIDIEVPLSQQQWANLPQQGSIDPWTAIVSDGNTGNNWLAKIERSHLFFDKTTRQRSIVLTVDAPFSKAHKLFPGMFLQAEITGKELENIWQLPASSLSQQGEIWLVDAQGLLNKYATNILFERGSHIYVNPVIQSDSAQVVIRPLSNFKVNMKVSPKIVNKGDS